MKGNRLIVGALVATIATVTGCTLTIDFDPRGVDVSLEGDWQIDGVPANATNCGAAGIEAVQLVFYDGGVQYEFRDFRFDCADGSFDTQPRGVLDHGRYQTQWVALGAGGTELGRGPMILLDVADFSVDHAILATVNFETVSTGFDPLGDVGSLQATWTLNGNPGDATLCTAAGIQTMQFVLYDSADTGRTNGVVVAMAPCADGSFDSVSPILAAGSYITSVVAVDSAGAAVGSFDSEFPFVITTPGDYGLMEAAFEFVVANEMTINLSWGTAGTDCTTAGAANIFWSLNDSTGAMVLSDTAGTCDMILDQLIFDDLPPDDYELFVDAESTDRTMKWQGTCGPLAHSGAVSSYDCQYELMP